MTGGDPASPDVLVAQPMARTGQPVVKITTVPASAARDALDGEAGGLLTDDPAALEYARTLPGYVDVPLEWNRTYVLLAPGGGKSLGRDLPPGGLPAGVGRRCPPARMFGPRPVLFSH